MSINRQFQLIEDFSTENNLKEDNAPFDSTNTSPYDDGNYILLNSNGSTIVDKTNCYTRFLSPITLLQSKFSQGGIKSTIVTLVSGTLGPGCLAMPNAFRASGIIWSFIQLFAGSWMSYLSIICLAYCAEKTGKYTYGDLATHTYGKGFRVIVDIVFFLNNFGTLCSYCILLQSNLCQTCYFIKELWWNSMPTF